MWKAVVDLASVAERIIRVVNSAGAFTLVMNVLANVSCSVERFVAAMAVLLPVLEIAFINPKMVLERA